MYTETLSQQLNSAYLILSTEEKTVLGVNPLKTKHMVFFKHKTGGKEVNQIIGDCPRFPNSNIE